MFISIRGTSGSGKSYLVKKTLHAPGIYHPPKPVFYSGRKQPLYYLREPLDPGKRGLAVLGHYESATGGCDTISSNDMPFTLTRHLHERGYDVLADGLLHSAEQHRTAQLHRDGFQVHIYYLTLTIEECLAGVNARRANRGNTEPVDPSTTAARHRTLRLHPPRFRALGVNVAEGDRAGAAAWLQGLGILPPDT
jgi:hypothetical protein